MKDIKKVMLIMCLMLTNIIIVNAETIKLKECEYTDAYISWLEMDEKERKEVLIPQMCKNISNEKYAMLGNSISGVSKNDTKFDLRDYNMVTSVKNQETTGACWAFATNAVVESNLLMNGFGEYDLSEAHLELSTQNTYDYGRKTFSRKADMGGSADWTSLAYFMNGWGPVSENYLPFQRLLNLYDEKETIESELITDNESLFDINKVTLLGNEEGVCSSSNIENIKEYLISKGALSAAIYLDPYSSRKEYYYYDGLEYTNSEGDLVSANKSVNHAVTIIGWDDTISKDNFSPSASRDGAFILKNSYGTKNLEGTLELLKNYLYYIDSENYNNKGITDGTQIPNDDVINYLAEFYGINKEQITIQDDNVYTEVGIDGYHYISYDDVRICNVLTGFSDIDNENEDNNYGYTNLGAGGYYGHETLKTLYSKTKYKKESTENEILKEVVMVFTHPGINYTIYFADKDTDIITDAEVVARGTSIIKGMETIKVTNKTITSDTFTIFVKLEKEDGVYFSIVSKPTFTYNNPFASFEAIPEVEYISEDAMSYSDVSDQNFHISLRVNTNLESEDSNIPSEPSDEEDEEEVTPPEEDNTDDTEENDPVTPPEDNEEETPSDNENKEDEIVNPPADAEDDNEPTKPDEDDKNDSEDYPDIDEDKVNTDAEIKIEENEYNKEHKDENVNQNVDQTIENPKTGLYIPIILLVIVCGVVITIKKNIKAKVYKI